MTFAEFQSLYQPQERGVHACTSWQFNHDYIMIAIDSRGQRVGYAFFRDHEGYERAQSELWDLLDALDSQELLRAG